MVRAIASMFVLLTTLSWTSASAQGGDPHPFDYEILEARPFLAVDYGMATPSFDGSSFDFETIGLLEFKLGYGALDSTRSSIVSLMESYIFFSMANPGLGSSGGGSDVGSEFNRFGLGSRFGYGYQGKSMGLDLYNQNSLNWTEFTASEYDAANPEAQAIFDRYGSKYRFGHIMESGADLRVTSSMAVAIGAEGAIVYPRTVFWPWFGSIFLYSAMQGVVEFFADEVVEASPGIGPVVYFLLKTGVSAGYYFASQSDMNWPFDSETPVTIGSLKIGATFTF